MKRNHTFESNLSIKRNIFNVFINREQGQLTYEKYNSEETTEVSLSPKVLCNITAFYLFLETKQIDKKKVLTTVNCEDKIKMINQCVISQAKMSCD